MRKEEKGAKLSLAFNSICLNKPEQEEEANRGEDGGGGGG